MTTGTDQDCSIGYLKETTYGTGVTVSRFLEFISESLDYDPKRVQGKGLRVGGRVDRSGRRVTTTTQGKGGFELEICNKGLGQLWEAALGSGTSTVVSGSTYQQLFRPGDSLNSMTLQTGIPESNDGTIDAVTYTGCMVKMFDIEAKQGEIATAKFDLDIYDVGTATGYASPSYSSGLNLFHFAQGAVTSGGTVTAPTTTALASGGTSVANVKDFSLKVDNGLNGGRFNFSGAGKKLQPRLGERKITGEMTVEYSSTTLRDAFIADTELAVTLTFTTTNALSTGFEQFQIVIPAMKLEGEIPKSNAGKTVEQKVNFTVLDNLTAAYPLWIVQRTSDTAL